MYSRTISEKLRELGEEEGYRGHGVSRRNCKDTERDYKGERVLIVCFVDVVQFGTTPRGCLADKLRGSFSEDARVYIP